MDPTAAGFLGAAFGAAAGVAVTLACVFACRACCARRRPRRGDSRGERVARAALAEAYGRPFEKARPRWLRPEGADHSLELDGFCADLMLAFEYQGAQHYEPNHYFHRAGGSAAFAAQVARDEAKARICAEAGVAVVIVPHTVALRDVRAFARARARELRPRVAQAPARLSDEEFVRRALAGR